MIDMDRVDALFNSVIRVGAAGVVLHNPVPVHERRYMNIKKHWLKSLAVAAVVAMVSANASADVVAAVTANGRYALGPAVLVVPGMTTPAFAHSGGRLVATYTAECFAEVAAPYGPARVDVTIYVQNELGDNMAILSPTDQQSIFCSSGNAPSTFSMSGVGALPQGTYRVVVRGGLLNERASGWMGARSLVVLR